MDANNEILGDICGPAYITGSTSDTMHIVFENGSVVDTWVKVTLKSDTSLTDIWGQSIDGRLVTTQEMATLKYQDSVWVGMQGRSRIFPVPDTAAASPEYAPFTRHAYRDWTEHPQDFIAKRVSPQNMGYRDLYRYIKAKEAIGADTTVERTDFQWKFSYPLINIVIVLFGLPIAVRVRHSGMALNFGIAMAITFAFRVLIEVFRAFGHNGNFSPEFSAWVPIGVFLVAGLIMLSRIRN